MVWPFNKKTPVKEKASIGQAQLLVGKDYSYSDRKQKNFALEGYMKNPTVFSCIDLISSAFARVPLRVYNEDGEEVTEGAYVDLLERPNPDEGADEFKVAAASWMLLTGNCFTERIMVGGMPSELWNWQPYDFTVGRMKGSRLPAKYTWRKGLQGERSWEVNVLNGQSDILHWRKFNPDPTDSTFGMPPLMAGAVSADTYNAAMKWRYNQVSGGGVMDGILSPKGSNTMDQKQTNSFAQALKEKFRGPSKAGDRMGVMGMEMTYTSISTTMKDAEWLGGTKLSKQEICEVYKVPTQLLGIEGSQTFANFSMATKALYYLAVIPLLDMYCSEMNRWLGDYFPGQTVGYSKSDIDALEEDRATLRQQKIDAGVFSINEIRAEFGMEPSDEPEADAIRVDPSKLPLGMDIFGEGEGQAEEVAKSLMRAGMPRAEAEQKAIDWFYDSKD